MDQPTARPETKPEVPVYAEDTAAPVSPEAVSAAAQAARPSAKAVPQPAPDVPARKHPEHLVRRAGEVGVHPAVIEALSTEQLTQVVIDTLTEARRQAGLASAAAAVARPPVEAASTPTVGPPAGQPSLAEEFDWGEYEDEEGGKRVVRKVSPDDLHPALVALIRRQEKRIREVEGALQQQTQQARHAQERTLEQRFDAAFAKSPRLFGTGPGAALRGTPEFARRSAVYAQVMAIPPEQRAGLTVEAAVEQVTRVLFGAAEAAGRQAAQVEGWNAGAVAVPTQRGRGEPPGRARAIQSVEEFMRESGRGELFSETTEDEFLG